MHLNFVTARLTVEEMPSGSEIPNYSSRILELLTANVVRDLPPNFHGIDSAMAAQSWLERMVEESRLCAVKHSADDQLIGFLFAFVESDQDVHIGYLLGEAFWGRGLASELLGEFVEQVKRESSWRKLIGGVARTNPASSKLLLKLGFVEKVEEAGDVAIFEYLISRSQSVGSRL